MGAGNEESADKDAAANGESTDKDPATNSRTTDPDSAGKSGSPDKGKPSNESLKYLLGGAGTLQVVLTAVGVSNGGIGAMVINNRALVLIGFGLVFAAVVLGGFNVLLAPHYKRIGTLLIVLGSLCLPAGIGLTGYLALTGPAVAKAASINVSLSKTSNQLILTAHVKASGIPESSQYWFEIDAREYKSRKGGVYAPLGPPLYQNQLGADSQGNIDSIVTVPLPEGNYPAVSIEAWNGASRGPCGSLEVKEGAYLTQVTAPVKATPTKKKANQKAKSGKTKAVRGAARGRNKTTPAKAEAKTSVAKKTMHGRVGCIILRLPR
jgi:hypothetical protein